MYYSKNDDKIPLGVVTCILEILTLTAIATFVKFLSPNVSIVTILFFRYVFCLPILFTVDYHKEESFFCISIRRKPLLLE